MASQRDLRDSFLKKHPNLRFGLGEWRQYDSGIWAPVSELVVKSHIQTLITQCGNGSKLSNGLVSSITELVRQRSHIPDQIFDSNPNILTFNDVCLDLVTLTQVTHSSAYYNTTKLNYNYDPTARLAEWDQALTHTPHREFFLEFAGYCATPETKYELALWLHGPPGGGKSTLIAGLEAMLGPRCCILGLNEIEKTNFGLTRIPGKTLAISTEQPAHFLKSVSTLNALISGETTTINRKFQAPFDYTPRVKLLWAMNELPRTDSGAGAGIFRRVIPMYCAAIPERDRNPAIKETIMQNGMAVMNTALGGLKRLRSRGGFDIPAELITAREVYRTQSDITHCFLEECCIQGDDCEIPSNELYQAYDKWCVQNGHRPVASNRLAADLQRLGFDKVRRSIGIFWLGIALQPDFPDFIIP